MNTLPKSERIYGRNAVNALISNGKWGGSTHLRYCYLKHLDDQSDTRIMVSVPKKLFKRAVKRNLLKRRMREAYRLHKIVKGYDILFSYSSKEVLDFQVIEEEIVSILQRLDK